MLHLDIRQGRSWGYYPTFDNVIIITSVAHYALIEPVCLVFYICLKRYIKVKAQKQFF